VNVVLFFIYHGDISNTTSIIIYIFLFGFYMVTAYVLKRRGIIMVGKKIPGTVRSSGN